MIIAFRPNSPCRRTIMRCVILFVESYSSSAAISKMSPACSRYSRVVGKRLAVEKLRAMILALRVRGAGSHPCVGISTAASGASDGGWFFIHLTWTTSWGRLRGAYGTYTGAGNSCWITTHRHSSWITGWRFLVIFCSILFKLHVNFGKS